MYQLLLYCLLNGLGFFFFLFVWNRLPKVRFDRLWNRLFVSSLSLFVFFDVDLCLSQKYRVRGYF